MITINGNLGTVDALKGVGYQPSYATKWIGPWSDTATDIDTFNNQCKQRGVKPAFHLFYWGDEIALETLKGTYIAKEYGGETETIAEYWKHVRLLAERIKVSGIQGALVSIEGEWNKRGPNVPEWLQSVNAEPDVFDTLFQETANYFKTHAPGTQIVTCPGQWTDLATLLARFPKMVASTDFVATQGLNTLYKQSEASFIAGADRLLAKMKQLQVGGKGKPIIVMDTAWSSYSGSYSQTKPYAPIAPATLHTNLRAGEAAQAKALLRLKELLPQFEAAGVKHLFYRGLKEAPQPEQYWGHFEAGWGVLRLDGTKKPGFDSLMSLAQQTTIDPRDAEISSLKSQLATCNEVKTNTTVQRDELMVRNKDLTDRLAQIRILTE